MSAGMLRERKARAGGTHPGCVRDGSRWVGLVGLPVRGANHTPVWHPTAAPLRGGHFGERNPTLICREGTVWVGLLA